MLFVFPLSALSLRRLLLISSLALAATGCSSTQGTKDEQTPSYTPKQTEETCLQWAEEDQIPKHTLQNYLNDCMNELRDNPNHSRPSPAPTATSTH